MTIFQFSLSQLFMFIFLAIYFGLIIGIRSYILYRKVKVNPIKKFGSKTKVGKTERVIQFALFLMLVIGLNFCFIDQNYKYFLPFHFLEHLWISSFGFLLSIIGLVITFIAQMQMKNAWRLGLDNSTSELVTTGLFTYSRNPIYTALGISFVGFFLIAPSLGSLVFVLFMFVAVSRKIRDEESFLLKQFPAQYKSYLTKVRRWV